MAFIKRLSELKRTDLAMAGGKGANLGALIQTGMPVPPGFVVTIAGYRAFVAANGLQESIRQVLADTRFDDPASLESASVQIRQKFQEGKLDPELVGEIQRAYHTFTQQSSNDNLQPFAVRSSATAEDLPDLSFAGQQDTYLNIVGEAALLDAVVRCWASLWTARAIGYRARNAIAQDEVALAVVVQEMVSSEASGVLFTANPLTGKRTETVIDATLGLGEALVSGQVEPDHYVVEGGKITGKVLGAKALTIQGQAGGGTVTVHEDLSQRQALPDEQILMLAQLGQQAAVAFGEPQDMEWAFAGGRLYVVQSRPITSLFPLPGKVAAAPLEVLFSFGVWQGMLDPYTPLGQDALTGVVAGGARLFGVSTTAQAQHVLLTAGERLFVNITGLIRNPQGRAALTVFISAMDPISSAILKELLEDQRLAVVKDDNLRNRWRVLRGVLPFIAHVLFYLLSPVRGRARLAHKVEVCLDAVRSDCSAASSLTQLADAFHKNILRLPQVELPILLPAVIAGQVPLQILLRLAADFPGGPELVLELTRALPYNVTTEMDLTLWNTAQIIRHDAAAAKYFAENEAGALARAYQAGSLPVKAQAAVASFLDVYGVRGVGEIDIGRPRWCEDPTHIFQVLQSYLQIEDSQPSPQVVFRRGAEKAQQAQVQLVAAFRRSPGGWFKARLARFLAQRVRELAGLRETPKFNIIRMTGILRAALLEMGQKLVAQGLLAQADDLFFLHLEELQAFERHPNPWRALVAERRETRARELRRKRVPRVMLSDGMAYHGSAGAATPGENADSTLIGSPVSAGVVEGSVRVVFDPYHEQLVPGEILVCPATDPAWTPLFLAAGGLVMEVGGMMTHGSVVAREYGIPAVVGVHQATERLKNGQRVRVDGSTGQVIVLNGHKETAGL